MMKSTGNLNSHIIGRTHGSGTWTTSRSSTWATMHRSDRCGKVCESDSFTKSWLEQAGGPIMEETRVPGSTKITGKSAKVRRTRSSSLHSSKWKEASEQQTWPEWLSLHWRGALWRTAKFRTPTTIIIFKLVTKPNMVECVFLGLQLVKMALARVARRHMVRPMVRKDKVEFTVRMAAVHSVA